MEIRNVTVLGAGTMGHGIAQVCAVSGHMVRLFDVDAAVLEKALGKIDASLSKLVEKGKLDGGSAASARARIETMVSLEEAVPDADLVVEAVPERMDLKLDLFRRVDRIARRETILATNTSSLSVTEIAGATSRPDRVAGLHFFNPVPLMRLVEIVRGLVTSDDTVASAKTFSANIGKEAIVVNDWPGFATSRLGVALGAEAIRMLEQGVASAADIDKAMELGYAHPMGPLKLTDLVGLDVRLAILDYLHKELGEQFRPPALLRQMVRAGKLGKKTGEGFYKY
jgi:3-hydroxybutyryl-CoA dehydrogenase